MSLRTLPTATDPFDAVSSMNSSSGRPRSPPASLISLTTIFATLASAFPAYPIGPVRSVAMPTLIGASAALAQLGRTTQLPTPVASAVEAKAKLPRKRRRLQLRFCLDVGTKPLFLRRDLAAGT